jgi:hypothetical protein
MAIKLTDLFARVPPEVEARVRRARDQARPAVQEALRAECRLVLRTAEETEQKRPERRFRSKSRPDIQRY